MADQQLPYLHEMRDLYFGRSPLVNPLCDDAPQDAASGKVARGGAWNSKPWWSRSATRTYDFPAAPANPKGFRVAMTGDWANDQAGNEPKTPGNTSPTR